jgi:hypothetical protein
VDIQEFFHKRSLETTKNALFRTSPVNKSLDIHSTTCAETCFLEIAHFLFSLRSTDVHALFKHFNIA